MTHYKSHDIVIIGGGISGLATLHYCKKMGLDAILLEKNSHVGGKIRTENAKGFLLEHGPESLLTTKPWGLELAKELNLESELIPTESPSQVGVWRNGKLQPLPEGMNLGVPTRFWPFICSSLISPLGKLRIGLELFLPRKKTLGDESIAQFFTRRFGQEASDYLATPLLSGIYSADPNKQSLAATFPFFRDLEEKNRSVIQALRKNQKNNPIFPTLFASFKSGMQTLSDALYKHLKEFIFLNQDVRNIQQSPMGWRIETASLQYECKKLVLTVSVEVLKSLVIPTQAEIQNSSTPLVPVLEFHPSKNESQNDNTVGNHKDSKLRQNDDIIYHCFPPEVLSFRSHSSGFCYFAFSKKSLEHLKGHGFVVPLKEKRLINAITFTSNKFKFRAPNEHTLIRVFFGGANACLNFNNDSQKTEALVLNELQKMLNIQTKPIFQRTIFLPNQNPQYDVGHLEKIKKLEASLAPNLHLTGSSFKGIGIPDCIYQANLLAEKLKDTTK